MVSLAAGFDEPVFGTQLAFRSIMEAISFPGRILEVVRPQGHPKGWPSSLASGCLTLLDSDVTVWLDHEDPDALNYLKFHTGCRISPRPEDADFAIILDVASAPLHQFKIGTDQYPDRSATLLIACESLTAGAPIDVSGPGIKSTNRMAPNIRNNQFWGIWADNNSLYPLGFDVFFFADNAVLALPRGVSAQPLEV
jgi:alpha-D-ribose 1-methylphosphonate 5-triphosphate synthase subunit PhnH